LFTLFVALNDASVTLSTSSQRLQALTTALYESQRGYNFDESGKDNQHADEPICPAGTFNKLIEKWVGLHPDCRIEFMTRQTAGLKLAALTKQAVTVFLCKQAAQVRDLATFAAWVGALQAVCCGDVEPLWSAIRAPVARVLFAEFGALFTGFDSVEFRTFVDAGRWVDVSAVPTARFELRFGCYAQTIETRLADSYRRYQSGVLSANRRCCYQYQSAALTLQQPRRSIKRKAPLAPLFEPQPHMPKRMRYV